MADPSKKGWRENPVRSRFEYVTMSYLGIIHLYGVQPIDSLCTTYGRWACTHVSDRTRGSQGYWRPRTPCRHLPSARPPCTCLQSATKPFSIG